MGWDEAVATQVPCVAGSTLVAWVNSNFLLAKMTLGALICKFCPCRELRTKNYVYSLPESA